MAKPKHILFIVAHRIGRSPGQRFRFEQYLEYIKKHGFQYTYSYIISKEDDASFYTHGKYWQKLKILIKSYFKRRKDLKAAKNTDLIFIYREAWMLGSTYFEKRFTKLKAKVIIDFDDAIWLNDTSQGNNNLAWLKKPSKIKKIIGYADMAFVGNNYLAQFAQQYNKNTVVIPTTIDTDYYIPEQKNKHQNSICIGWTGSSTTLKHLKTATSFLKKIQEKYGKTIYFKLIADIPLEDEKVQFKFCKWSKEQEVNDLQELDIGIMPLPDDEWSKGKCGFKGLQYMALEIPTIMSPVGVNTEIIEDGVNGFLATEDQEWVEKISMLIDSEELRKKIGKAGRRTVIDKYSFHAQKDRYIKYFNKVLEKN